MGLRGKALATSLTRWVCFHMHRSKQRPRDPEVLPVPQRKGIRFLEGYQVKGPRPHLLRFARVHFGLELVFDC